MTLELIVMILTCIATLIAVLTPIIKLSSAITKLTVTVDLLNKSLSHLENIVNKNTDDINEIKIKVYGGNKQ